MNSRNSSTTLLRRTSRWCKAALFGAGFALVGTQANAQVDVSGALVGNGSHPTLSAAFTAINGGLQTGANITIGISGNTTEPAGGAILNAGVWATISIQPTGGAARTISGAATAGLPLIDFNGADNVTVDGLNSGGNSLTIENTTVSATSGTSTIRFQTDATGNTINRCSLKGSATMANGTNGGVVWFGSAAISTGNDNNTISNCDIGPSGVNLPSKCIYFSGSSNTDPGTANSGISITGNNIFDYFSATVNSAGIDLNSGSVGTSITNNKFYQGATRTQTGTGLTHRAISINNSTGNNYTITGNTIGFANSGGTGTYTVVFPSTTSGSFIPIFLSVGTTTASNCNSNTIAGIAMSGAASGTSSSAPFRGIYVSSGLSVCNSNTIGSQSATGSITYTSSSTSASDVIGMFNFGSSNWTTNNNLVGGMTVSNSSTGAANLYGIRANTSSAATWGATGNTVGGTVANSMNSTSTATGTSVNGMLNSSPAATWTGNTVRNMTVAGGTGTTTTASMIGICINASSANHTLGTNTIFNLSNSNATAATVVTGIQYTASTGANVVERNLIYGLTSATTSASAEINGIRVAGGTTTYRNNMIALGAGVANAIGTAPTNSSTTGIIGFNEALGTNTILHNSIYIGGTATAGSGPSIAFNGVQTTNTRSFRDNIFQNARTNSGASGSHYAIKINGTAPNPTGLTINNNVYFANGASGAVFGFFNSLPVANIAAWRIAVGQDLASFEGNPQYNDPTNATPDLHLHPTNTTVAEGNGVDLGVTLDYDGQTRSGLTPVDIGADAGNFTGVDLSAPAISFTALSNTCSLVNRTLSASITDASGVPTAGAGLPVLYWRINAGAWTPATGTFISGSQYDFSFGAGVIAGDVVNYYIVAQDNAGTPNVGASPSLGAGGFTANPPAAATPPSVPASYNVQSTLAAGTYLIPTNFASLTAAVAAYNTSCLGGAIVFEIEASYVGAGESYPITINANADASSSNTLTIQPGAGVTNSISGSSAGAIILLNGADYVRIQGSNAPVTNACCPLAQSSRNLTITNTNTGTSSAVIWMSSGSTNNAVRNCVIQGNAPTTTLFGVGMGGGTISTTSLGTANNSNTIENNAISRVQFGIYSQGASSAAKNTGNAIVLNQLNTASPNNVGNGGIRIGFETSVDISCNSIANINASGTGAFAIAAGIVPANTYTAMAGNEVTGATITRNVINNIVRTGDGSSHGIVLAEVTSVGPAANEISNNMISGVNTTGATPSDGAFGIRIGGGATSSTNVLHNSVSLSGVGATTGCVAAMAINGANPVVNLKNNIFSNTATTTTGAKTAITLAYTSPYTNLSSNNNDFHCTAAAVGSVGGFNSAPLTNFATWQSTTGGDASSVNVAPVFVSATDLHLDNTNASNIASLMTGGTTTTVTTDIDCDTRGGSTPTIGADEFTVPACATAAGGGGTSTLAAGPYCAGGTTSMSNTGAATGLGISYQWRTSTTPGGPYTNVVGGTGATTANYTTGTLTAGTYYYVMYVKCSTLPDSTFANELTLVVNGQPSVGVSPTSGSYCAGDAVIALNASGAVTYAWSPAAGLNTATGASVNAAPGATTTYTVTGTDGNGCTNTATSTITFNGFGPSSIGTPTATPNSICSDATSNLSITATNTTDYTVASTPFAEVTPSGTPTALCIDQVNQSPGTYTGTSLDDGFWTGIAMPFPFEFYGSAVSTMAIGTNGTVMFGTPSNAWPTASPDPSPIPDTDGPNRFIAGLWIDHDFSAGTTNRLDYFTEGTAPNRKMVIRFRGQIFSSSDKDSSQVIMYEGSNIIDVMVRGTSATAEKTIGVENNAGTAAVFPAGRNGSTSAIAANEGWRFTPSGTTGLTYAWTPNPAGSLDDYTSATPISSVDATTTYTVTVGNGGSCTKQATVLLNVTPVAPAAAAGPDQNICENGVATLAANAAAPGTGAWTITGGGTGTFSDAASETSTFTHTGGAGPITLRWTITNASPCAATFDEMDITITPAAPAAAAGADQNICASGVATLAANAAAPGTGTWTITGGGTGTFSNAASETSTFTHTGGAGPITLRWTITNAPCAATFDEMDITITPAAPAAAAGPDATICGNLGNTVLAANAAAPGTGAWTVESGGTGTFSNAASETSTFTHTGGAGPIVLRWTITNAPCAATFDEVSITISTSDGDGDGIIDCADNCPTVFGVIGSACDANNQPGFQLGALNNSCVCVAIPCTETVSLDLRAGTAGASDEIGWEVVDQNVNTVICAGGTQDVAYLAGITTPIVETCCLPAGCYRLRVYDSAGDGFATGGGYQLRETFGQQRRIIDNTGNFTTGSTSAIANTYDNGAFCVPIGDVKPMFNSCDKRDWTNYRFLVVGASAAVSATFDVTPPIVQPTNSGYEYWFFDPNGGYSYRRFISHANPDPGAPQSGTANAACHFKINRYVPQPPGNQSTNQEIPYNTLLNVRVRGRVNGNNQAFGPACFFKIDAALAYCPLVSLQDDPADADYSCNVTRVFGGVNSSANRIVAKPPYGPAMTPPTPNIRYQFRFRIPGELGQPYGCITRPMQTSPTLYMNWTTGQKLKCSATYEVDVRVSRDGGATWCTDSPTPVCNGGGYQAWGKICTVTITPNAFCQALTGGNNNLALEGNGGLTMYPNPNRGDQLFINLSTVETEVNTVSVDIFDLSGKKVTTRAIPVQDGTINTALDLNGSLAGGMYLVNITAGTKVYTERLVIQP